MYVMSEDPRIEWKNLVSPITRWVSARVVFGVQLVTLSRMTGCDRSTQTVGAHHACWPLYPNKHEDAYDRASRAGMVRSAREASPPSTSPCCGDDRRDRSQSDVCSSANVFEVNTANRCRTTRTCLVLSDDVSNCFAGLNPPTISDSRSENHLA